jgi:tetratricopeptide (TPR) repeat protein
MPSHAANRLLLASATLAGAAVATALWPGALIAGAAAGAAAGVGGNFLHQCTDDLAKALRESPAYAHDYLHNQDLRRLVGETIAARLRALASDQSLPAPTRLRLPVLALKAEAAWLAVADHPDLQRLNEDTVTQLFAMSPETFAKAIALDAATWADFLEYLDATITDASISGKLRRILTPGGRAVGTHPLDPADRNAVGRILTKCFPNDLTVAAKQAFGKNDPAYAALQLRLLRELMTDVRNVLATAAGASAKLDALFVQQTGVEAQLKAVATAVRTRAETVATAIPPASAHDVKDILNEIEASHAQVLTQLSVIATDARRAADNTDAVPGMSKQIADIHARLSMLLTGGRNATGIPNNLPDPSPHFAAREVQLISLHAKLRAAQTVAVGQQVALWADGGVGKTMLAEHYGWVYLANYPGGAFKINGEAPQLSTELASLAPALKIPSENRPPDDVARDVEAHLEATDSLLIIDNVTGNTCWMEPEYRRFLPSGRCRRIVTTRDEFIDGATMSHLDVFDPAEGRAVLARHRPDADDPTNQAAVEQIVEWFGGLGSALLVVGVYMTLEEQLAWANYLVDLRADGLTAARLTHDSVKEKITYKERFDSAFDKTLARLNEAEQRCLEYAALLPEDMVPGIWLKWLLTEDTTVTLAAKPGYGTDKARPVLEHLTRLGLLRTSKASKQLLSMHRVLRARVNERAAQHNEDRAPLWSAVAACLKQRRAIVVGKSIDYPAILIDAELRWELAPLAATVSAIWDAHQPGLAAAAGVWVANVLRVMGRLTEAEACLRPVADVEAALGPAELANCYSNLATIQQDQGDLTRARATIERAITIQEKHFAPDHPTLATPYSNLATIQQDQGDLPGARASIERAIAIDEKHFAPDHPTLATRYSNLAMIQQAQGDLPGARTSIERAITIKEKHFAPDHPTLAVSYSNLATIQQAQGDLTGARASIERAIAIDEKHFAPDHPTLATPYSNLAMIQQDQGDLPGARASVERAIAIDEKHFAPDHPTLAVSYANLAMIQQDQGDLTGARASIERAITIQEKHFAPDHPTLAVSYSNFATIQRNQGDLSGARASIERAITIKEKHFAPDNPNFAAHYNNLAHICHAEGAPKAACEHFKTALAILLKHFDENHPNVKTVRKSMKSIGCGG